MTSNEIILFDIDGTIADLHTAWVKKYNHMTGNTNTVDDVTEWYIPNVLPDLTHEEHYEIISNPYIYVDVEPYPGALEFVEKHRKYYQVGFVSHCPYSVVEAKFFWLKRFGFTHKFDEFLPMNSTMRRAMKVIALYDDRTETLNGLDHGWLIDRSWNLKDKFVQRVSTSWTPYLYYTTDLLLY